MKKNDPIKKIDIVLDIFRRYEIIRRITLEQYLKSRSVDFGERELDRILKKLLDDRYVYQEEDAFSISIEGDIFIGYEKQRFLDDERVKDVSRILIQEEIYRKRLLLATWSAGIVAFLLLLYYILIWFYPHYSDYPYVWIWETIPKKSK
jgi:hypothetical protein